MRAFICASLMGDVLQMGGRFRNGQRCRKDLLLLLVLRDGLDCSMGGSPSGWDFWDRGWWRRAGHPQDPISVQRTLPATKLNAEKGRGGRGGYASMYECIRVRSSGTGVWLIHHSAALGSFSHYTRAWWNLTRHNFSYKKKKLLEKNI